ncbi:MULTISPECIES: Flp family type IVb pilin [unclassified Brevundimonas]|uniref:Flp family type IVb pilin n=1 Tax=unclassified Brevundimonas TaxID=2622653 RepID=UPI0025C2D83C|nr:MULTISPECIES: Flp family type IVb pilin [unclassified Brevundimonas]
MRRFIGRFLHDDSGATAIEYGLIASLIFVAIIAAIGAFTARTGAMYDYISETISTAIGGA